MPADIKGARSRSHGPAAERTVLGLGEPESAHCWTGTACRAVALACSVRRGASDRGWRQRNTGQDGPPTKMCRCGSFNLVPLRHWV